MEAGKRVHPVERKRILKPAGGVNLKVARIKPPFLAGRIPFKPWHIDPATPLDGYAAGHKVSRPL